MLPRAVSAKMVVAVAVIGSIGEAAKHVRLKSSCGFCGFLCLKLPCFWAYFASCHLWTWKTCQADSVQKKAFEKVEEKPEIKKSKTKPKKVKRLEEPMEDLEEPMDVEEPMEVKKVKKPKVKVVTSHQLEAVSSKKKSKKNDKKFADPVDPGEMKKKPKKGSKKEIVLPEVVPKASKATRYLLIFSDFTCTFRWFQWFQMHFSLKVSISFYHHRFILYCWGG